MHAGAAVLWHKADYRECAAVQVAPLVTSLQNLQVGGATIDGTAPK